MYGNAQGCVAGNEAMGGYIRFSRHDGVAELVIDRPISATMAAHIEQMLRSAFAQERAAQQAPVPANNGALGGLGTSAGFDAAGAMAFAQKLAAADIAQQRAAQGIILSAAPAGAAADQAALDPAAAIAAAVRRAGGGA